MNNKLINWVKTNLVNKPPEGCNFKIDDVVDWVDGNGVALTHKIIGFNYDNWFNATYQKYIHLDTDCYYLPHSCDELTLHK